MTRFSILSYIKVPHIEVTEIRVTLVTLSRALLLFENVFFCTYVDSPSNVVNEPPDRITGKSYPYTTTRVPLALAPPI